MDESNNNKDNNTNNDTLVNDNKEVLKDYFFSTDLEQYFKKGTLPVVFIAHTLSAILLTYIIISEQKHLSKLQQETRLLQESFYFNVEDIHNPSRNFRRTFYFNTIGSLLDHTDKVIIKLFTINETIPYSIHWLYKNLTLSFTHKNGIEKLIHHMTIKHKDDNPLRSMTHEELRRFLSQIKQMSIDVQYQTRRLNCNVCQLIKLTLNYDISRIGFIAFSTLFSHTNCNSDLFNNESIKTGFIKANSIICIVIIILTMIESYTIIMKIGSFISIVYCIKQNVLSINHFSFFVGENSLLYSGKTAWDLITKKDILSLFSKWLLFIVFGNILVLLSCVCYILTPLFNNYNQILFGMTTAILWFSLAYYFQRHKTYYCFYQTLKKSLKVYKNLFVTFVLLFTGFVLFHLTIYTSNEKWYNGFHGSFITLFAAFLGDLLLNIWNSTLETHPLLTIFLSVVLYIVFIGCHLRVMFTMTQESFEISNLERKKDWLDNNFSLHDYVVKHFNVNDNDNNKDESNDDNRNFALSDMWMRAIVNAKDMNNLLDVNLDKLQGKGYNIDSIKKYLIKYQKAELRRQRSHDLFNQIIDSNFDSRYSSQTKNSYREHETIALGSKSNEIDNIFNNLHLLFEELSSQVIPIKSKGILLINNTRILSTCIKAVHSLDNINKDL